MIDISFVLEVYDTLIFHVDDPSSPQDHVFFLEAPRFNLRIKHVCMQPYFLKNK